VSAYSGPQGRGARRNRRDQKRTAAEARNALTPKGRRRSTRRFNALHAEINAWAAVDPVGFDAALDSLGPVQLQGSAR
jgi:hypothetical protein